MTQKPAKPAKPAALARAQRPAEPAKAAARLPRPAVLASVDERRRLPLYVRRHRRTRSGPGSQGPAGARRQPHRCERNRLPPGEEGSCTTTTPRMSSTSSTAAVDPRGERRDARARARVCHVESDAAADVDDGDEDAVVLAVGGKGGYVERDGPWSIPSATSSAEPPSRAVKS